jgi:Na+-translocating ferredoxin:NAD+ oxidoreductase RnfA subunit
MIYIAKQINLEYLNTCVYIILFAVIVDYISIERSRIIELRLLLIVDNSIPTKRSCDGPQLSMMYT